MRSASENDQEKGKKGIRKERKESEETQERGTGKGEHWQDGTTGDARVHRLCEQSLNVNNRGEGDGEGGTIG